MPSKKEAGSQSKNNWTEGRSPLLTLTNPPNNTTVSIVTCEVTHQDYSVNKQLGFKTLVLFNENSLGRPFPLIVFFILMRLKSLENSIFQHHFPVVLTMLLQSYFKLCVYWRKNILLHCRQYCQPSGKKHNLVFLVRLNVSDRQT